MESLEEVDLQIEEFTHAKVKYSSDHLRCTQCDTTLSCTASTDSTDTASAVPSCPKCIYEARVQMRRQRNAQRQRNELLTRKSCSRLVPSRNAVVSEAKRDLGEDEGDVMSQPIDVSDDIIRREMIAHSTRLDNRFREIALKFESEIENIRNEIELNASVRQHIDELRNDIQDCNNERSQKVLAMITESLKAMIKMEKKCDKLRENIDNLGLTVRKEFTNMENKMASVRSKLDEQCISQRIEKEGILKLLNTLNSTMHSLMISFNEMSKKEADNEKHRTNCEQQRSEFLAEISQRQNNAYKDLATLLDTKLGEIGNTLNAHNAALDHCELQIESLTDKNFDLQTAFADLKIDNREVQTNADLCRDNIYARSDILGSPMYVTRNERALLAIDGTTHTMSSGRMKDTSSRREILRNKQRHETSSRIDQSDNTNQSTRLSASPISTYSTAFLLDLKRELERKLTQIPIQDQRLYDRTNSRLDMVIKQLDIRMYQKTGRRRRVYLIQAKKSV